MQPRSIFQITLCLLTIGGPAICQIQPSGRQVGMLQFDATIEIRRGLDSPHSTVFARYWVCPDYYACAVVWAEPNGISILKLANQMFFSSTSYFLEESIGYTGPAAPMHKYPKPIGQRDPFRWGSGIYHTRETRFAEADALARRVYARDLENVFDASTNHVETEVSLPQQQTDRSISMIKLKAEGKRLRYLQLLDKTGAQLCKVTYQYSVDNGSQALSGLVAELPTRPQKLAVDMNALVHDPNTGQAVHKHLSELDYVYHKGGRTCTVVYKPIQLADKVVRLPVQIEVRITGNKLLVRRARLMNFRLVNLTEEQVLQQAREFGSYTEQDRAFDMLRRKFLFYQPPTRVPGFDVDPNDMAFVNALIAKYPVPGTPNPGQVRPRPRLDVRRGLDEATMKEYMAELDRWWEEQRKHNEEYMRQWEANKPAKRDIEPNDLRAIRNLIAHYRRLLHPPLTEEQKQQAKEKGYVRRIVPEELRPIDRLYSELHSLLNYHRRPALPEDAPPRLEPNDIEAIKRLQAHYGRLLQMDDKGIGGKLKAMYAICMLDLMVKDYDAFEGHVKEHLKMLLDCQAGGVYLDAGAEHVEALLMRGQYERATRIMRAWAQDAVANLDPEAIISFGAYQFRQASTQLWPALHLADRLLARSGLSALDRYGALAMRAVAMHSLEGLLADRQLEDELAKMQVRWVLRSVTAAQISRQAGPAVQQAVNAWRMLGSLAFNEARPYLGEPEAQVFPEVAIRSLGPTPLQEISAVLDQIVSERTPKVPTKESTYQSPQIGPMPRQPARQPITRPPRR